MRRRAVESEGARLEPETLSALLQEIACAAQDGAGEAWSSPLHPGQRVGGLELVRELGRGGFGVVWEARDPSGRTVALKAVRPGPRERLREERLLREAEAAARLSHPNLVTLLDAGRSEAGPYLTLELLSPDVASHVPAKGRAGYTRLAQLLRSLSRPPTSELPGEAIEKVLEGGYEEYLKAEFLNADQRVEDIRQLAQYARGYEDTEAFLAEVALLTELSAETVSEGGEPDEKMILSSVHQAKGLEWRAVFVVWLADGRFPASQSLKDMEGEEEERRLFYVAATRAKDELYLTYPVVAAPRDRERQALVNAKQQYLAEMAQLTGIDQKTIVEMTLYGFPMMKVDMPGARLNAQSDASIVGTTDPVATGPGSNHRFENQFEPGPFDFSVAALRVSMNLVRIGPQITPRFFCCTKRRRTLCSHPHRSSCSRLTGAITVISPSTHSAQVSSSHQATKSSSVPKAGSIEKLIRSKLPSIVGVCSRLRIPPANFMGPVCTPWMPIADSAFQS